MRSTASKLYQCVETSSPERFLGPLEVCLLQPIYIQATSRRQTKIFLDWDTSLHITKYIQHLNQAHNCIIIHDKIKTQYFNVQMYVSNDLDKCQMMNVWG